MGVWGRLTTNLPSYSYFGCPPSNFSFKSVFWLYFFVIRILSEVELNYCCCSYLLPDEVTKPYWANW